mgnify:CR=1 FL=1
MPGTGNQLRITKAVIIKKYSKSAGLCQCRLDKNDIWFMPVLFQQENVPVLIGGKVVKSGDIIVGDDGGVIIISPAIAE